jgi:hypothetical protein
MTGVHNRTVFQRVNILDELYLCKDSCDKKTLEILSAVFVKRFFKYYRNLTLTEGKMCQLQQMGRMQDL